MKNSLFLGHIGQESICLKLQAAKLPSIHSMKQWGVHDSFRETFTLWVVNRKETKARGSDHRGELRIGHG